MVDEVTLSSVLSDFARTLTTDFPIQGILDHLVERIVDVLDVTAAGVTLISPGTAPRYVAASDADALAFERLQTELGHGPCLTAYQTGDAVTVPDLRDDGRFLDFVPTALAAGVRAVFAFPLRHGAGRLGALDLYRDRAGELDPRDMAAAQTLADVAAAYLLNAQARQEALEISDRFRAGALHDPLTGLPNRTLLQQRIEHAAQRAHRSHTQAAVLFADLDRFKEVNDTYGHRIGDELLVGVARRLSDVVRPGDTLARVSGDEFVILCEDMVDVGDVLRLAARVGDAFTAPFVVAGTEISCTASVGVAYSGPGEAVTDELITHADLAMYQAKRLGGATHQALNQRSATTAGDRGRLDRDLRTALSAGHLDLAYQPIVRTRDRSVVGVEALLRWTHPQHGTVPALTTVGIAEQNGLIEGIGAWVLERGCADRGRWLAEHPGQPVDVSVNVSVRQLMGPGFADTVAGVLERTQMDPAALVLELTEGVFIEDGSRATAVLADLKALGVRLTLDDFGTGYCSLGYLRRFPVDAIKIDQDFVADIGHDASGAAIVAAVSDLAHALGMDVTAEGVETLEQHDVVTSVGCEHAQGFLYGRPLPASGVPELLRCAGDRAAHRSAGVRPPASGPRWQAS
ncbi:putative bifunctional diguanylate cyclase/phosphodiesterase [Blastococcus sp. VKM Ac-2987]|uniref:putative bifunctional diguanylate cyclase/phosphodiesterase n=1 Tax=Blastococcus sp. VKM Ac-2987 TaxID=3004141 RepID=UPI0022AB82D2|nr:EAL domain-containing protein [Blastococcus sp. VKM Ac-2987]MCZ2858020.1 EAL domain-containing protein [Blastococcus sp. VKM Ac-2987]